MTSAQPEWIIHASIKWAKWCVSILSAKEPNRRLLRASRSEAMKWFLVSSRLWYSMTECPFTACHEYRLFLHTFAILTLMFIDCSLTTCYFTMMNSNSKKQGLFHTNRLLSQLHFGMCAHLNRCGIVMLRPCESNTKCAYEIFAYMFMHLYVLNRKIPCLRIDCTADYVDTQIHTAHSSVSVWMNRRGSWSVNTYCAQ